MSNLPTSWADIKLSEVAQVTSGIGFPNEYQGHTSGDLPFFKVSDISHAVLAHRGVLKTANHYVSHEVAEKLKGKPLAPGSTVFAKIGEAVRLNRRAKVVTPCLIDNNVMAVKATAGINDRYVYQFLRTIDFGESARSTTVPSLRKGDVEELRFPLAPIAEQKRIADKLDTVLTRVDAVNTRLARVAPILKRFRQSVLAAATSGRLTEDWRSSTGASITDWEMIPVSDACTKITDGEHITPALASEGVPLISAKDVREWGVDFSETKFVSEEFANTSRRRCDPSLGDVLVVSRGATVGRTCFVTEDRLFCLMGSVLLFKPDASRVLPKFLAIFLASPVGLEQLTSASGATAQAAIYIRDAKNLPVSLGSLDEQTEIVRRVETLFAFADRLEARLQTAKTATERLTPAMLAKAFRGELVPQDPNDEPASELLRRLQQEAPPNQTKRGRKSAA